MCRYSRIASSKSPSFCTTNFSASLVDLNSRRSAVTRLQLLREPKDTGISTVVIAEHTGIRAHVFAHYPDV